MASVAETLTIVGSDQYNSLQWLPIGNGYLSKNCHQQHKLDCTFIRTLCDVHGDQCELDSQPGSLCHNRQKPEGHYANVGGDGSCLEVLH